MTERIYYHDAQAVRFSASVVAVENHGLHVVLDRTAFYPTSGGQPHDTGQLHGIRVIDVIDDEQRIVHVCADAVPFAVGDTVDGQIDWARRFHHMQQHSGQHLLSALLADAYGWPTVSVHFGDESNTVDVAAAAIDPAMVEEIESRVNLLAVENHEIRVSFEDAATAEGLRKASDREGMLRIVTIDGVDKSACGGTHVSHTGAIGAILLRRVEKTKGNTRLEFICGQRALARARRDAMLLTTTARLFTAAPDDVPALVEVQQRRVSDLERERKGLLADLAGFRARDYWERAAVGESGVRRIVLAPFDGPVKDAEPMVQALLAMGPCTVLVLSPSAQSVMLGASDGSGVDAGQTLRPALQAVGGRGGGSPRLAQGSVPDTFQLDAVARALGFSA